MYRLDTSIVSELRKPRAHRGVVAWLQSTEDVDLQSTTAPRGEPLSCVEARARVELAWTDLQSAA